MKEGNCVHSFMWLKSLALSSPGWGRQRLWTVGGRKTRSEEGSKVKRETQARGQFGKEILLPLENLRLRGNVRQLKKENLLGNVIF